MIGKNLGKYLCMFVLLFIVLLKQLHLTHCQTDKAGPEQYLACVSTAVLCCIAHFTNWFWGGFGGGDGVFLSCNVKSATSCLASFPSFFCY